MCLNKFLDEVRDRLLGTKPLPSLREVFFKVRRKESRKHVMLGSPSAAPIHDKYTFTTLKDYVNNPRTRAACNSGDSRQRGRPWCDHC